jgi:hypothetical protein
MKNVVQQTLPQVSSLFALFNPAKNHKQELENIFAAVLGGKIDVQPTTIPPIRG